MGVGLVDGMHVWEWGTRGGVGLVEGSRGVRGGVGVGLVGNARLGRGGSRRVCVKESRWESRRESAAGDEFHSHGGHDPTAILTAYSLFVWLFPRKPACSAARSDER